MGGKSQQSNDYYSSPSSNVDYSTGSSGGQGIAKDLNSNNSTFGDLTSNQTTNTYFTDGGATEAALKAGQTAVETAIESNEYIAKIAIDSAGSSANDVLRLGSDLSRESLGLAGDFVSGGNRLAESYGDRIERAGGAVIDFASNEAGAARDMAYDAAVYVADGYRDAAGAVLDTSARAMDITGDAYENANQSILAVSRDSNYEIAKAHSQASSQVSKALDDSIAGYRDLFMSSQGFIADTNVYAQKANEKALDYVFQSTKDATERNTDVYVKYATYAALGVVGFMSLAMMRK